MLKVSGKVKDSEKWTNTIFGESHAYCVAREVGTKQWDHT